MYVIARFFFFHCVCEHSLALSLGGCITALCSDHASNPSSGAGSAPSASRIPLCAEEFEEQDEDGGVILLDEHAQSVSVLIMVRSWCQKKAGFGMLYNISYLPQ